MLKVLLHFITLSVLLVSCSSLEKSEDSKESKKQRSTFLRTYLEK